MSEQSVICQHCNGAGLVSSWAFNGFHDLKCDHCGGAGFIASQPPAERDTRPAPAPSLEEILADTRKACEHACEAFVALSTKMATLQLVVAEERRELEKERLARVELERRVARLEGLEAAE